MAFEEIPVRENGDVILAEWFNGLRASGLGVGSWVKYSVGHADLSAAALTQNITLLELPIKGFIEGILLKTSIIFAGGTVSSLLFDLGIAGDAQRWASSYDGMAAVSNTNFNVATVMDVLSFTAANNIVLKATSVGANLVDLTAGNLEIWIKKGTLG